MKKLLFLLLPIVGFAYSDCCEMISTNYHFKDMAHQKSADPIAYFDFHSEGDGFIRFSSQKALEYSHYPVYHSGTITYKGKETPIETPMQMDTVE